MPATALSEPGSVVISQQHSIKYFGNTDPIDSILYLNDSIPLKVNGVFKDLPRNTHFRFDIVITTAGMDDINLRFRMIPRLTGWGQIILKSTTAVQFAELEKKMDDQRKELYDHWENTDPTIFVQPLKDIAFSRLLTKILSFINQKML